MAGKTEQMKGRAKEAAGDLTGDKDLKAEGTVERATGKAEEEVGKVEDKADEALDKVKGLLHPKK